MGTAMKEAMAVQKEIMKDMNIDELADIKDEMDDMMMDAQEMNEAVSSTFDMDINEADLDAELADLENQVNLEEMNSLNTFPMSGNYNQGGGIKSQLKTL